MLGPLLTSWTIRLALLFYAAVLGAEIASPRLVRRWGGFRWFWTIGCALFLAHVACAFHFYHHWSPAEAYENTALRTGQMLGVEFGAGIYFSYFFAVLWTADAAWWWIARQSYVTRPWWVSTSIHAYLFFIAFNGAVVFEAGPTRWFASAGVLGLLLLLLARILGRSPVTADAAIDADSPPAAEPSSSPDA
jgi:hypothetical protein